MDKPITHVYFGSLDTRHFTFEAFGLQRREVVAALRAGWALHQRQTDATLTFSELTRGGDVQIHRRRLGVAYRDGSALQEASGG